MAILVNKFIIAPAVLCFTDGYVVPNIPEVLLTVFGASYIWGRTIENSNGKISNGIKTAIDKVKNGKSGNKK
jgi:hypothetical protein